jgi:hypothetical protein
VMKEIRDTVVHLAEQVSLADICARSRLLHGDPIQSFDFVI